MQDKATHLQILIGEKIAQQEDLNIEYDKICIAKKECECKISEIADQVKSLQDELYSELQNIDNRKKTDIPRLTISLFEKEARVIKQELDLCLKTILDCQSYSDIRNLVNIRDGLFQKYMEINSAIIEIMSKDLLRQTEERETVTERMSDGTEITLKEEMHIPVSQIESTLPSGIKIKLSFNRQINMKEYGDIMQMIINLSEVTATGNDKIELKLPS